MSRPDAEARRAEIEQVSAPDALLAFVTIEHPALSEPIRAVSDVVDYEIGGLTFVGAPFGFKLITDSEETPRAELTIQNVDRRIGKALLTLSGKVQVALEIRSSADFDLTVVPRVPLGSVPPIYRYEQFALRDVRADVTQITGTVMRSDFSTEPWPSLRAIERRLPGLFFA